MNKPLAQIDLNLLVALRTLLEERSVTKAAERLYITQPAMSKTLQRLRELFEDELFTRSSKGLVPTPKTLELEQPLLQVLEFMESSLFGSEFHPATAKGEIHICAPEMFVMTSLPDLASYLFNEAPGVHLKSRNLLDDYADMLANGTLDFAIYLDQQLGDEYATFPLYTGSPSIWLPADHELAEQPSLSISDLIDMPYVSVFLPGIAPLEISGMQTLFASHGIQVHNILRTTQLLIAMEVICRQGAFMLGPQNLSDSRLASASIVSRPLEDSEFKSLLQVDAVLIQHQRSLNSPLHNWIRELILSRYSDTDASPTGYP